jgi:hypothetical protein
MDRYRPSVPPAEPQDLWVPASERSELQRINERFLELLKREKMIAADEEAT